MERRMANDMYADRPDALPRHGVIVVRASPGFGRGEFLVNVQNVERVRGNTLLTDGLVYPTCRTLDETDPFVEQVVSLAKEHAVLINLCRANVRMDPDDKLRWCAMNEARLINLLAPIDKEKPGILVSELSVVMPEEAVCVLHYGGRVPTTPRPLKLQPYLEYDHATHQITQS
jgi:hypothetical protein